MNLYIIIECIENKVSENKGIVLLFECEHINELEYKKILKYVSEYRRNKSERYNCYQDRVLSVIAEFSLVYLMKKYFNLNSESYTILRQDRGKPYFAEKGMPKFNMSHTRNLVAVLIADTEIGIDVEKIKNQTVESIKRIMKFAFTSDECKYIESRKEDQIKCFYSIWTYKEAYCKMTGQGLWLNKKNECLPGDIERYDFQFKDYYINICGISGDNLEIVVMDEKNITNMCCCIEN